MKHSLRWNCACSLLLLSAAFVSADVIVTSDGSRLVGTIEQWADGTVVLDTEFAGRLKIDAGKIKSITTEGRLNVEFTSGDRLVGTLTSESRQNETVMHTELGEIPIAPERIKAAWRVGADSPDVIALKQKMEQAQEALKPRWTTTLEVGGSMREGNIDTKKIRGRFDLQRKTDQDLLKFFLAVHFAEQDDLRTENEYKGGIWYENQLDERQFWYTRTELEFDEFENLDLRATASAGLGRYWLKQPERELKTSAGLGYRHEAFNTGRTTGQAVIDLALNYRVDLAPWVQLTHSGLFSPAIEDFGDYRLDFDTAFVFPFKQENWKLKLGMTNQYSSNPQPGIVRLDNTYYANVVLELK